MDIPSELTLGQLLARRADGPETPALVYGDDTYTFQDLYASATAMAAAWRERGLRPGDVVAVWLPNSVEWVVTDLACALAGAVLVPVNVRLKAREVAFILTESQPTLLVMTSRFLTHDFTRVAAEAFPAFWSPRDRTGAWPLAALTGVVAVGPEPLPGTWSWSALLAEGRRIGGSPTPAARSVTDPMLIVWTSGTTSRPKGAVLDHRGLAGIGTWYERLGFDGDDRVVASMPLYYIAGHYYGLLGPLLAGGRSILGRTLTPDESLQAIDRHGGTMLLGGPSSYLTLAGHPERDRYDLKTIRRGYVGGAAITPDQVRTIREDLGVTGLVQVYGMTESQGVATSTVPGIPDDELAYTVGSPLPGVETRVVDPETREEIAAGARGEMLIRGRTMTSYIGLDATQQAESWDGGWLRTGDLMSTDADGVSRYHGRLKDVIKAGGENVAAAEVEELIRSNPDVEEVAVVAIPDGRRGEVVGAAVEFRDPGTGSPEALLAWLKPQLATFKLPRHVYIVASAADWPRNVSHKIVKTEVRERMIAELS